MESIKKNGDKYKTSDHRNSTPSVISFGSICQQ